MYACMYVCIFHPDLIFAAHVQRFGISTFVYSRRRPFHPRRLVQLLKLLPVKVDADNQVTDTWQLPSSLSAAAAAAAASSDTASAVSATADAPGAAGRVEGESTDVSGEASAVAAQGTPELTATEAAGRASLHAVIRSKGFVWLANAPKNLNYWSHAGHFFSLESLHEWCVLGVSLCCAPGRLHVCGWVCACVYGALVCASAITLAN
jgi:hypothetical protein